MGLWSSVIKRETTQTPSGGIFEHLQILTFVFSHMYLVQQLT